jgi:hypothetical protein
MGYEISTKIKLILFIVLFVAFGFVADNDKTSSKKATNDKISTQQAEQEKGREDQIRYGKVPFDTNITKIPKGFYGPRFSDIYNKLKSIKQERYKQELKDEFETTKQYNERMKALKSQRFHIIDGLYLESIIGTTFALTDEYDADKQEMVIQINIDPKEYADFGNYIEDSYIGENIFGVKKKVDVKSESNYFLVYSNIKKKDRKKNIIFKMSPDEARKKKDSFKGIALLKLRPPYIDSDFSYSSPTIDLPQAWNKTKYLIIAELLEIWIYDEDSGEIIQKIKYPH